ncbi:MAG: RDD family protein [Pseudomonadota bacterium]
MEDPQSTSLQPADRLTRLGAQLIDGVIVSVATLPILFLFGIVGFSGEDSELSFFETIISTTLGLAVFFAINYRSLQATAQTVGKKLLKIRIAHIDGSKPKLETLVLKRYLPQWGVVYVPFIGGILNLVNVLFIFREDRRCVHDLIADTRVVVTS